MGLNLAGFAGTGTFARGVHPPERKHYSAEAAIEVVPVPKQVLLPLLQNIGAPSAPVAKPKQKVAMGEMVAKGGGFVSTPLHSPIAGTVQRMGVTTLPNGRHVPAMPIKADGDQMTPEELYADVLGGEWPTDGLEAYEPQQISTAIQEAGIVGHGGAAFPTHVKVMANDKKPVDTILINACECEPYLTPDYRIMLEAPAAIVAGAILAARSTGARDVVIGIEDNKPEAIEKLRQAVSGTPVKVAVCRTKYPQGSEKQLIMAITKRAVPMGGLPLDVGVVVSNVGTAAAIARAVLRGKPLTHRVVSVTGPGIAQPKNLLVPIGISYGELIDFCGGLTPEAARVLSGGPMMGFAFSDMSMPVTKGTSGVTVMTREHVKHAAETSCVRCGRCVDVCPMHLVPTRLALAARHADLELMRRYHILGCFECGSCAYICPAGLPLVQLIRMGKAREMASRK